MKRLIGLRPKFKMKKDFNNLLYIMLGVFLVLPAFVYAEPSINIVNLSNEWMSARSAGNEANFLFWTENGTDKKTQLCWILKPGVDPGSVNLSDKYLYHANGSFILDNQQKEIKLKWESAKCAGIDGYNIRLTDAQAVNIDDYVKLGNDSYESAYGDKLMVQYVNDYFELNVSLLKNVSGDYVFAPEEVFINTTGSDTYKFGAFDNVSKNMTSFKYVFQSTSPIEKVGNNKYKIFKYKKDGGLMKDEYFYNYIDVSDVCSRLDNLTCIYNESEYFLHVTFYADYNVTLDRIVIDPILDNGAVNISKGWFNGSVNDRSRVQLSGYQHNVDLSDYYRYYRFLTTSVNGHVDEAGVDDLGVGGTILNRSSLCIDDVCAYVNTSLTASNEYMTGNPSSENFVLGVQFNFNQTPTEGYSALFGSNSHRVGTNVDGTDITCSIEQTNGTQFPSVVVINNYVAKTAYTVLCWSNTTHLCGNVNNGTDVCSARNGVLKNEQWWRWGGDGDDNNLGQHSSGAVTYNRSLNANEREDLYLCLANRGRLDNGCYFLDGGTYHSPVETLNQTGYDRINVTTNVSCNGLNCPNLTIKYKDFNWTDDLILYLDFDGYSIGDVLVDDLVGQYTGTVVGSGNITEDGYFGNALDVYSTSADGWKTNERFNTSMENLSGCFWYKTNISDARAFSIWEDQLHVKVGYNTHGTLEFKNTGCQVWNTGVINNDTWTHMCWWRNRTACGFIVNGTEETNDNSVTSFTGANHYIYVGKKSNDFGFAGNIDEVMMWNRTLTKLELKKIYNYTSWQFSNILQTSSGSNLYNISINNASRYYQVVFDLNGNETTSNLIHSINTTAYNVAAGGAPDTTPPAWTEYPGNFTIIIGNALNEQLNATDGVGVDTWFINDTTVFNISQTGVLVNLTNITPKYYYLSVEVNDSADNQQNASFWVYFNDTTAPTFDESPTNITIQVNDTISIQLNVTESFLDSYTLNDTNFSISGSGLITNATVIPSGIYYFNVSVNDTSSNIAYLTFYLNMTPQPDTTPPSWTEMPGNFSVIIGTSLNEQLNATDNIGVDTWWINDTTVFNISQTGVLVNLTNVTPKYYYLSVEVNDSADNQQNASFWVYFNDTTAPTFNESPTNISIPVNNTISIQINVTEQWIDSYTINDTNFSISATGLITNATVIPNGVYYFNVSVNDTSGNIAYLVFYLNMTPVDLVPPSWTEMPGNFTILIGSSLNEQLNATDNIAVDTWLVNDTTVFALSAGGVLTNATNVTPKYYYLAVEVNDTSDNQQNASFWVYFNDTTAPTFDQSPTNISIEINDTISIQINVTESFLDSYTLNDTNFSISGSGLITNSTVIPTGIYYFNVTVNDTSGNFANLTFYLNMTTPAPPAPNATFKDKAILDFEPFFIDQVNGTVSEICIKIFRVWCYNFTTGYGAGSRWTISGSDYVINDSGPLDVNETRLNATIDARLSVADTNESLRVSAIQTDYFNLSESETVSGAVSTFSNNVSIGQNLSVGNCIYLGGSCVSAWSDVNNSYTHPNDISLFRVNVTGYLNSSGNTTLRSTDLFGGNGNVVSSGGAGGLQVYTSTGEAGAISFSNTADIGISNDGLWNGYNYDGAFIFKQKASNPTGIGEFIFIEEAGDWRFAMPSSGAEYGTYNPRSMIVAGPSTNNETAFNCTFWGFNNLDCDTSGTGADLGVQDDLQVQGFIYTVNLTLNGSRIDDWSDVNLSFTDTNESSRVDELITSNASMDTRMDVMEASNTTQANLINNLETSNSTIFGEVDAIQSDFFNLSEPETVLNNVTFNEDLDILGNISVSDDSIFRSDVMINGSIDMTEGPAVVTVPIVHIERDFTGSTAQAFYFTIDNYGGSSVGLIIDAVINDYRNNTNNLYINRNTINGNADANQNKNHWINYNIFSNTIQQKGTVAQYAQVNEWQSTTQFGKNTSKVQRGVWNQFDGAVMLFDPYDEFNNSQTSMLSDYAPYTNFDGDGVINNWAYGIVLDGMDNSAYNISVGLNIDARNNMLEGNLTIDGNLSVGECIYLGGSCVDAWSDVNVTFTDTNDTALVLDLQTDMFNLSQEEVVAENTNFSKNVTIFGTLCFDLDCNSSIYRNGTDLVIT